MGKAVCGGQKVRVYRTPMIPANLLQKELWSSSWPGVYHLPLSLSSSLGPSIIHATAPTLSLNELSLMAKPCPCKRASCIAHWAPWRCISRSHCWKNSAICVCWQESMPVNIWSHMLLPVKISLGPCLTIVAFSNSCSGGWQSSTPASWNPSWHVCCGIPPCQIHCFLWISHSKLVSGW